MQLRCPASSEALGVGYFFLMTMDLSPTPQSSIYDFVLEALGVGYFLKRLLTSHPPRNPPFIDFPLEALGVGYFF